MDLDLPQSGRVFDGATEEVITAHVMDEGVAILSAAPDTYIQYAMVEPSPKRNRRTNYMLEYQDGSKYEHYRATQEVREDSVVSAFLRYLRGDLSWRSDFLWDKMLVESDASSRTAAMTDGPPRGPIVKHQVSKTNRAVMYSLFIALAVALLILKPEESITALVIGVGGCLLVRFSDTPEDRQKAIGWLLLALIWALATLVAGIAVLVSITNGEWTKGIFWLLALYFLVKLGRAKYH